MDDNLQGSIMDSIIAEEGDKAWGYFGFKEVADRYRLMSLCVLKPNTLIYAIRFA